MSAAKDLKKQKIDEIKEKIQKANSIVLVDYKGINVEQDTALRTKFRQNNVEYRVLKNRLAKIAFNELGINDFDSSLEEPTAFAFGYGEATAPAKIASDAEDAKNVVIKCGYLDNAFIDAATIKQVAKIPSKEVLVAQVLGLLQGTIAGFARVINAIAEKQQ